MSSTLLASPGSVPWPPLDITHRTPHILTLARGAALHRFYTAAYAPIYFDRGGGGRLNAPDGSYGVLYVAKRRAGAFAEAFLREPGRTLLAEDFLAKKAYVRLQVNRPLRLVKLSGPGLGRLGATAEVVHGGGPYALPQAWSSALKSHPICADGIAYTARHDDQELCYALFEPDPAHAPVIEIRRTIDLNRPWFWQVAEPYGVGLAPG